MQIGFIGLGIMGSRMVTNLLRHDHTVTVYNRTAAKAATVVELGATQADSPAAVAQQKPDVLFTMLAQPDAVRQTALGADGFLQHLPMGALWVDCSTVNPTFAREMAAAARQVGVRHLDAPVAGSKAAAANAELTFIVGGPAEDVATAQPLFDVMGSRTVHVGEAGMGNALKIVLNDLLAVSMLAFAEVMAAGQGMGIPREMLLNVILNSPVAPAFLAGKRGKIEADDFSDTEFPLRWMQKDLAMMTGAAWEVGTAMPLANSAKEIYQLAVQHGLGDEDFSAIYRFMQQKEEAHD